MMTVDHHIPLPVYVSKKYRFHDLGVGDSFFVTCKWDQVGRVMNSLTSCRDWAQKRTGCKFVLRRSVKPFKGESGVRIWRIA